MHKISTVVVVAVCCGLLQGPWVGGIPLSPPSNGEARDRGDISCTLCLAALEVIQDVADSNKTLEDLFPLLEEVCILVMDDAVGWYGSYLCPGFIHSYGPVIQYSLAHAVIEPRPICQALHLCDQQHTNLRDIPAAFHSIHHSIEQLKLSSKPSSQRETVDTSSQRWRVLQSTAGDSKQHRPSDRLKDSSDTITILQLADIHLDKLYSEGSPSTCHLYVCCRSWYNGTDPAGHYGAFKCDLPMVTLELLLDTINQLDPQPDFIVYTGDIPPHDIWNETWSSQFANIKFVVDLMAEKLPNITIYPAMGNHETWPVSEYIGTLSQYQHLTQQLAQYWKKWVEFPPDALASLAKGGYYNIKLEQGFRLVAFNSDYGDILNFYAFLNEDNQYYHEQWKWLTDQLTAAEQAGEKVLLMAHIPPGHRSTVSMYEEFYLNLTRHFGSIIVGHLFGHTHSDQFRLVQDKDGLYGVLMVAPSVTPYGHMNPSFRVFSMNRSSHQLLGYHQYHLNLTKANELAVQGIQPQFELAYTTSQEYGLKDLSPQSWATLAKRFEQGDPIVADYNYNLHGRSEPSDMLCDASCRKETVCAVTHILSENYVKCREQSSEHL